MARYYYAGGKRIALALDTARVGVDRERAVKAGLATELSRAAELGTALPGGIIVVSRAAFTKAEMSRLRRAGALRKIYRAGKTMAVPLPEVRVEYCKGGRSAALAAAKAAGVAAAIDEESSERLVLRPNSGSGEDALDLGNFIYERVHPASSSARMVQVVTRPDVVRRA